LIGGGATVRPQVLSSALSLEGEGRVRVRCAHDRSVADAAKRSSVLTAVNGITDPGFFAEFTLSAVEGLRMTK
jgi:hypothetical protein